MKNSISKTEKNKIKITQVYKSQKNTKEEKHSKLGRPKKLQKDLKKKKKNCYTAEIKTKTTERETRSTKKIPKKRKLSQFTRINQEHTLQPPFPPSTTIPKERESIP